jgi:hypothetical protein
VHQPGTACMLGRQCLQRHCILAAVRAGQLLAHRPITVQCRTHATCTCAQLRPSPLVHVALGTLDSTPALTDSPEKLFELPRGLSGTPAKLTESRGGLQLRPDLLGLPVLEKGGLQGK